MSDEISVQLVGPIFSRSVGATMKNAVRQGLFDVAAEITGTVQEQLYPGHGWVTGRLRGSIGARQYSDLGYEVKSGATTGSPLSYTYWIETGKRGGRQTAFRGYQMFEKARNKWDNNRSRIDKIMTSAVMRQIS